MVDIPAREVNSLMRRLHFWLIAAFGLLLLFTVVWGLAGLYGAR
jgi:hypothetical protein